MSFSIAIDGPAGAGKSSISKKIAERLDFIYVDTGAMYRAMALFFIKNNILSDQEEAIADACSRVNVEIQYIENEQQVILNGENVNAFIRTEEVGNMASAISKYPAVRKKLVELQRKLADRENVIMDGRDIGTYVLPNANIKIYLTASTKVRANRRYLELKEKGITCNPDQIERDIMLRDEQDMNRDFAPLIKGKDAIIIDSTEMTMIEVVECLYQICKENGA